MASEGFMGGAMALRLAMVAAALILPPFLLVSATQIAGDQHLEDPLGVSTRLSSRSGKFCDSSDYLQARANASRLQHWVDTLAAFSDTPSPSVTRILYSDNDVAARRYIRSLMSSAGLDIREDAIGNIFGRWQGSDPSIPAVASGSHTDAIPYAGKYDGVIGVVGAIEAIKALQSAGFQPRRSIEVIMFTSEEPTRFGLSCIGSRMMAAHPASTQLLKTVVDKSNISFFEAAKHAGYDKCRLEDVAVSKDAYAAFVELHIEQGPLLEEQGVPIGIVTAIAGPASLSVSFEGDGGHAGGVLMPARNDAGLAGAELALLVEKHVLATGSEDTVGTTGVLKVFPGAVNSIPRLAQLEIDIRDIDGARRDAVVDKIRESASAIAKARNVRLVDFSIVNQDPPATSADFIVEAVKQASEQLGLEYKMMVSRAYHDSLFMSRIAPTAMIFIPCYKGYSHRPDEHASEQDMKNGVEALALSLAKLATTNVAGKLGC